MLLTSSCVVRHAALDRTCACEKLELEWKSRQECCFETSKTVQHIKARGWPSSSEGTGVVTSAEAITGDTDPLSPKQELTRFDSVDAMGNF